jgi:DNA-binding NarL/FixJ family response regulator
VALRCLLVDDNEAFLASATRLLESQGLEVVGRASSGREALELDEQLDPEVLLVDVQLGEEDGIELGRQLAARRPDAQVILISTHSEDELAELLDGRPGARFLPKRSLGVAAIERLLG